MSQLDARPSSGGSGSSTISLGLINPKSSPYNATLDGVADDYEAFKRLHEAINAGTVRGYYLTGKAKISKELPAITKPPEILCFNGGGFDASEIEGKSGQGNQKSILSLEGSRGARVEI